MSRKSRRSLATACALATFGFAGCRPTPATEISLALGEVEFERPTRSGEPHLARGAGDRVLLTWLEPAYEDRWAVRLATRDGGSWSEPRTIRTSNHLFVNWADFPSSVEMSDGTIAAHWLEKVEDAPYAYHVMLAMSTDDGVTWGEPFRAHDDESPREHGFVSMVPWDDGAALVWLDGREMAPEGEPSDGHGGGAMSVRFRTLAPDGSLGPEVLLDDRTCECCQTSLAHGSAGLIAAYRDRSPEEIRDIAIVRGGGEAWSEPAHVSADGWTVPGCPVNGPQLSANGSSLVAVWYTGAPLGDSEGQDRSGEPQTYAAFSEDGGATFGPRIRVDEGVPLGRLDVERLEDGSAVVVWLEAADGGARVLARRVTPSGELGPILVVSETSGERASGFPRMTRVGNELLFAWTLPTETGGVRVRSVTISD